MKKLFKLLCAILLPALLTVGCQSEDPVYSGQRYVMFSDSVYTMPVLEDNEEFCVPVAATVTADYDRNYSVEIITNRSTALRGYHFDFADGSNNITIKAGEMVANVRLKPIYEHVGREDSLVVSLRLLEADHEELSIYGSTTRVDFLKCYPFRMDDFLYPGGHMFMLASFPFGDNVQQIRVDAEKIDDHNIRLLNAFSAQMPLRLELDDSDPTDYRVYMIGQKAFKDANYGDVYMRTVDMYPSYFNVSDRFFVLYLEAYLPQMGSFGVYQYIFKCISDDEAADMDNGVTTRAMREPDLSTFNVQTKN